MPSGIAGQLVYATDLFSAATAHRLVEHLARVLPQLGEADRPLAAVTLLSAAERAQVVEEWNATAVEYGPAVCLHALVAAQAARTPAAVAASGDGLQLSYGELHGRAAQLAHYLQRLGVGPEVRVGLDLERSPALLIAMVGVWYAGGAYVPLDPAAPPARRTFVLTDAAVRVVITTRARAASWSGPAACAVVCLDGDAAELAAQPRTPPPLVLAPAHAAYLIYTSGSTGVPKGVLVPQGAVVNLARALTAALPITAHDVVAAMTTPMFDIAVLELLVPLGVGATVAVLDAVGEFDVSHVNTWLTAVQPTVVQATPSAWGALLEGGWVGAATLQVLAGGEVLPVPVATELRARARRVWNLYGPTETTIWSMATVLDTGAAITIGRPVANTQIYLVDAAGDPVPVGVAGELWIGGRGVARGYVGRPGLTAAQFVPDGFSGQAGARVYRTGDRARWRADGAVEYLGRLDYQVKVRGHRIELGEIEAALGTHAAVQQAVVVARGAGAEVRLVAYVVGREAVAAGALRAYLQERVPGYMVPAAWVMLAALPLTANGKVDRGALPAPEGVRRELARAYVAPRTAVEEELARIWGEVLGLERVGVADKFFELGGDSILSIQIIARARQAGWQITAAAAVSAADGGGAGGGGGAAAGGGGQDGGGGEGDVPLLPVQAWFFEQAFSEAHHFNQAVLLRCRRGRRSGALRAALAAVVAHHDALRLRFSETATGWRVELRGGGGGRCARSGSDGMTGAVQAAAEQAAMARVQGSLALAAGPLTRMAMLRRGRRRGTGCCGWCTTWRWMGCRGGFCWRICRRRWAGSARGGGGVAGADELDPAVGRTAAGVCADCGRGGDAAYWRGAANGGRAAAAGS